MKLIGDPGSLWKNVVLRSGKQKSTRKPAQSIWMTTSPNLPIKPWLLHSIMLQTELVRSAMLKKWPTWRTRLERSPWLMQFTMPYTVRLMSGLSILTSCSVQPINFLDHTWGFFTVGVIGSKNCPHTVCVFSRRLCLTVLKPEHSITRVLPEPEKQLNLLPIWVPVSAIFQQAHMLYRIAIGRNAAVG